MNPQDFVSPQAGRVIETLDGEHAFVPAPLPPKVEYDPSLTLLLSQADTALSELSMLGRYLPNPDLFIAPYTNREAVSSCRINGTRAGMAELMLDEIDPRSTPQGSDVKEVGNYVSALNRGIKQLIKLPFENRLVLDLHHELMEDGGHFRDSQNWIGPPGSTLATATYVPPPPDLEMPECLHQWEIFVNQRGKMPELIQCALMHEHFEAIHPFLDGNGRLGRLLIPLFLIERGRLSKPLLYLSSYFEQSRNEYFTRLQRIRTHGDWDGWLRYFLAAVRDTSRSAIEQSHNLRRLRDRFRGQLNKKYLALTLLDELFINPYITVIHAAHLLDVSSPTAAKTIRLLEHVGILKESTGREWARVWLARSILKVLEESAPIRAIEEPDQQTG